MEVFEELKSLSLLRVQYKSYKYKLNQTLPSATTQTSASINQQCNVIIIIDPRSPLLPPMTAQQLNPLSDAQKWQQFQT